MNRTHPGGLGWNVGTCEPIAVIHSLFDVGPSVECTWNPATYGWTQHLGQRGDACPVYSLVQGTVGYPREDTRMTPASAKNYHAHTLQMLVGNAWRWMHALSHTYIPYQEGSCS